ncbi:hypothetical protein L195_g038690, partial [Trifolium pratense]
MFLRFILERMNALSELMLDASPRTNAQIAKALATMANMMAQNNADKIAQEARRGGEDELRLERFLRNNPPVFKGRYDPD